MKYITKTSKQAKKEKENKDIDGICPECSYPNLGIRIVREGLFKSGAMTQYSCFECGCEWNTGWESY